MSSPERSVFRDGVAAALLFALLLEWLRPLLDMSEWSGVYRISPFAVAFALFVLIDWLRLSPWLGWPLKLIVCLCIVGYLFDSDAFPHPSWLLHYVELTMRDLVAVADRDFAAISPDNRTMLFVLGWSMMIAVMYASVVERKRALWFVAATLLYLLGLQLWPGVNTANAVIRTVWLGFLLMGLQQFSRLEGRFALRRSGFGWPAGLLVAVPLLLAAVVAAGLWLPPGMKTGVMRPFDTGALADRLASWNAGGLGGSFAGSAADPGAAGWARTGYDGDDSVLGGPVRPDDSIAFTARTEQLTYWHGETKTVYTGKGWENGDTASDSASPLPVREIAQAITIVDPSLSDRLFAGGPVARIDELVTRSGRSLLPDDALLDVFGSLVLTEPDRRDPLQYYRLAVTLPEARGPAGGSTDAGEAAGAADSDGAARTASEYTVTLPVQSAADAGTDASVAQERFRAELQLPVTLPIRVRVLAETVAMNGSDDYGRAKAIESFLKTNYAYRMDTPELPETADDFADTFLFDSKEGYCDYFSTAMVVMLRSVGIPARWVKGFAPGEVTADGSSDGGDGLIRVTVRNRDAHSWVEAYIAGSGWTTFDPTPGNAAAAASEPALAQAVFAPAEPDTEKGDIPSAISEMASAFLANARVRLAAWGADIKGLLARADAAFWSAAAVLPLIPLAWVCLRRLSFRRHAPGPYTRKYAHGKRASAHRALDKLWRALFRRLGRKTPALTVREYVDGLALAEGGKRAALLDFVKQYEAVRYGGAPLPRSAKRSMKQLWRQIKQTGGDKPKADNKRQM